MLPLAAAAKKLGTRPKSDARPASGIALIVVGVWLVAQGLGGNLAGRLRSAASPVGTKVLNAAKAGPTDFADLRAIETLMKNQGLTPSEARQRLGITGAP